MPLESVLSLQSKAMLVSVFDDPLAGVNKAGTVGGVTSTLNHADLLTAEASCDEFHTDQLPALSIVLIANQYVVPSIRFVKIVD